MGAVAEMAHRFDVNNKELNKRRFQDQYAHIISASKAKTGKASRGSKFVHKEVWDSFLISGRDTAIMQWNLS